jgi:NSS family neurotransmitter:Na+ symporter
MALERFSLQGGWRSRWTFIAVATGASVGLGNLWKFAYLAGANGGGAFVFAYIVCVLLVGCPVMIAEVVLGSRGRGNPVATMQFLSDEIGASRYWQLLAAVGLLAGIVILSYYAVIASWGLMYTEYLLTSSELLKSTYQSGQLFNSFLTNVGLGRIWHAGFLVAVVLVVSLGIRRGIGTVMRMSLLLLVAALLILAIYAAVVGDFLRTAAFLFSFDLSVLSAEAWLLALGHAFFSLSIGVAAMIAFGAYAPERRSITAMVSWVVFFDVLMSLLAGLAIFPLVFSFEIEPGMGPGLVFVALPYAFSQMPNGPMFGALFFTVFSLVALSSSVALLEPGVAWLNERYRLWRPLAAALLGFVVWWVGLAIADSIAGEGWMIAGKNLFSWLDFISANILLPASGLLVAVFVGWRMRKKTLPNLPAY